MKISITKTGRSIDVNPLLKVVMSTEKKVYTYKVTISDIDMQTLLVGDEIVFDALGIGSMITMSDKGIIKVPNNFDVMSVLKDLDLKVVCSDIQALEQLTHMSIVEIDVIDKNGELHNMYMSANIADKYILDDYLIVRSRLDEEEYYNTEIIKIDTAHLDE